MAKKSNGTNKSEEVRQLLKANPAITAKETVAALGEKGIKISNALFYFTKGQMKGRKALSVFIPPTDTRHRLLHWMNLFSRPGVTHQYDLSMKDENGRFVESLLAEPSEDSPCC